MDYKMIASVPCAPQAPISQGNNAKVLLCYSFINLFKLDCPSTCSSCTSSSNCQSCKPNYGLQSNMCSTCPSGTYLSSSQTCNRKTKLSSKRVILIPLLACPSTCSTCTSETVCTNCLAGYGLQNDSECATCPTGTYLSGQQCKSTFSRILLLICFNSLSFHLF